MGVAELDFCLSEFNDPDWLFVRINDKEEEEGVCTCEGVALLN